MVDPEFEVGELVSVEIYGNGRRFTSEIFDRKLNTHWYPTPFWMYEVEEPGGLGPCWVGEGTLIRVI